MHMHESSPSKCGKADFITCLWFASAAAAFVASAEPSPKLALGQPCKRTRDCVSGAECVWGSNPGSRVCQCQTATSYELVDKSACVVYIDGTGRVIRYLTVNSCDTSAQCRAYYSSYCVRVGRAGGTKPALNRCLCNESAMVSVDHRRCFPLTAYVPHDCESDSDCENVTRTTHCVLDLNRSKGRLNGCLCDRDTHLTFDESGCLEAKGLTNFSCQSDNDCAKVSGATHCVFQRHNSYGAKLKRCMLDRDAESSPEGPRETLAVSARSDSSDHRFHVTGSSSADSVNNSKDSVRESLTAAESSGSESSDKVTKSAPPDITTIFSTKAASSSGLGPFDYGTREAQNKTNSSSSDIATDLEESDRESLKASKASESGSPNSGTNSINSDSPSNATTPDMSPRESLNSGVIGGTVFITIVAVGVAVAAAIVGYRKRRSNIAARIRREAAEEALQKVEKVLVDVPKSSPVSGSSQTDPAMTFHIPDRPEGTEDSEGGLSRREKSDEDDGRNSNDSSDSSSQRAGNSSRDTVMSNLSMKTHVSH